MAQFVLPRATAHAIFRLRLRLLCWLLLLSVVAAPAQRIKITGTVRDDNGMPVELANVRVVGTALLTLTNLKGKYTLYCPKSDSIRLQFSQIGFMTRFHTIRVPRDSVMVNVTLHPSDYMLQSATIQGIRRQTGTTQKIAKKALENMPSTSGNAVEELIQSQAGVSTHSELSSQYNVRGGSFDENVVYLNGLEVFRPMLVRSGQQEGLSIINPDMVENIVFSSGGFEARYGDKMSSVLDITYKHPEKFEAKLSGSMLGGGAYVGWGNRHVSLMTSARYKTTRYLLGTLDTKGEYHPSFLDYQAYLNWRPSKKWSLDVMGNISNNHFNFVPKDRSTSFGTLMDPKTFTVYFDGQEKDFFHTYYGAFNLTRHFTPKSFLSFQFSTFSTQEQENYDISGEYWLQEATAQEQLGVGTYMEHARNHLNAKVYDWGLRFRTQTKDPEEKVNNHTLQFGLNYRHENIQEVSREWEMRDSMGYSLPISPQQLQLIYSMKSNNGLNSNRFETFAQDTWRFKAKAGLFNLTYGLRYSFWQWNKESFLSPRVSLGFLPANNDHWTFRFATGYYYQAPFFKELRDTTMVNGQTVVHLNPRIKAQRSIHFVAGADYTFRFLERPFKFTAEAYYKALSRLNPYTVNNVRIVYTGQNVASGYVAGVDFKLYGEFVPGTDSWITFSLMKAQETINGMSLPQPTDQRFNFSLFFTDYFPGSTRWRASLKMAFAGGLPFGPPHSERKEQTFRAPAYKRVDLGLSYRLPLKWQRMEKFGLGDSRHHVVKNVWLGLDAFNLLGIQNVNSYYWVTDITNTRYAVPNYLTGRQLNFRFSIDF